MRLWCDVYNAAGTRLGAGPIALISASVTRRLDALGSIRLSAPGTDARARALLVNEARVRIFCQPDPDSPTRELGRGVIRRVRASGTADQWRIDADGVDDLDALTRIVTKLRRTYSASSVSAIAADLVALVPGWSASTSGGNLTDARFDGVTVFRALLALAESQGLHLRAGTAANTVEIGAFGASAGLRLVRAAGPADLPFSPERAVIETITLEYDSAAVCTRIYPIGAGIGEAWLTIEKATRNLPYTRQVATLNGIDQHFLEDFPAATAYGVIEKMGRFGAIAPLSNSPADLENAANALYDIAAAWLQRYSQRQDAYRVTARGVGSALRVGDRVRLIYDGVITRDGQAVQFIDLDADMWVMEATERADVDDGFSVDLVLATVDRHPHDPGQILIGGLEELRIESVTVKPYFNRVAWVYDRVIDPLNPASVEVELTDATQRLNRCRVKVRTRPFTATVTPSVIDTAHRHTVLQSSTAYPGGAYYLRDVALYDEVSDTTMHALMMVSVENAPFLAQTAAETDEDVFKLNYGLTRDTRTPANLRIAVNGVDRTAALGGPWRPSGGSGQFEVDITPYILAESVLQQAHEVEISCDSGQGEVEVRIEVYETIQSIAV